VVRLAHRGKQDLRGLRARTAQLARAGQLANQGLRDLQGQRAPRETQALAASGDRRDCPAKQASADLRVSEATRVAHKDLWGLRVIRDLKGFRDRLALKGRKDLRVFRVIRVDLGERLGPKDRSALRVPSVTQVNRVIAAPKDPKDRKAPLGPKDPSVTQASRAMLALRVLSALKDFRGRSARRAHKDP
jgi:hypothetical protein